MSTYTLDPILVCGWPCQLSTGSQKKGRDHTKCYMEIPMRTSHVMRCDKARCMSMLYTQCIIITSQQCTICVVVNPYTPHNAHQLSMLITAYYRLELLISLVHQQTIILKLKLYAFIIYIHVGFFQEAEGLMMVVKLMHCRGGK